jgi:hypothetical protein
MWRKIPPFSFSAGERKIMAHFVVNSSSHDTQKTQINPRVPQHSPDYSYYQENERQSVDRGGTLEERRHQRQMFHRHVRCSARCLTFSQVISQQIASLAASRQSRFAFAPEGFRLDRCCTMNNPG